VRPLRVLSPSPTTSQPLPLPQPELVDQFSSFTPVLFILVPVMLCVSLPIPLDNLRSERFHLLSYNLE